MRICGFILGLILAAQSFSQDIFGDEKQAYVLMPAEVIASSVIDQVEISADGRYVLFRQLGLPKLESLFDNPKASINGMWFFYDRKSKKTLRLPIPGNTYEVMILGDGENAFFANPGSKDGQGFVNLKSGAIVATHFDLDEMKYTGHLPFAPFLVFQGDEMSFTVVKPDGSSGSFKLPYKLSVGQPTKVAGVMASFGAIRRSKPAEFISITANLQSGELDMKPITREQWQSSYIDQQQDRKFWWDLDKSLAYIKLLKDQDPKKQSDSLIPDRARLGLADSRPQLSPDNSYVAYQDAGALLIRDIQPIDAKLAAKALAEVAKAKAINDAKQAALSMLMYASDMDDVLPGQEGWEAKVMPYIKNQETLRNFNYTFKGGNISGAADPASTELGFTVGPGGRAVAYLDGHVKWIPNP